MSCNQSLIAGFVLVTAATVVAAAEPVITAGADLTTFHRVTREADLKLQKALHKKIQAKWNDASFKEVIQTLAGEANVNLRFDEQAMEEEGIDLNSQIVTLDLGETTIWTALHYLLPPLGLTWTGQNGIFEITTKSRANDQLVLRTYDVAAIAKVLEPQLELRGQSWRHNRGTSFPNPRMIPPGVMGAGGMQAMGTAARPQLTPPPVDDHGFQPFVCAQFGGGFGGAIIAPAEVSGGAIGTTGSRAEVALIQAVQNCCQARWMALDMEGGDIAAVQGRLIVRQTYHVQFEIQSLLQAIDAVLVRGVKARTLQIQRPAYPQDEDARVVRQLAESTTIETQDQALEDVLQMLATRSGIRLWIDVKALSDEGVRKDTPVTLSHVRTPLSVILSLLLDPLGLTYEIDEGTLVVTTKARADETMALRVYNVAELTGCTPADLVFAVERCTGQKWIDVDQEGGVQYFLGTQLLVIRQTQSAHLEIATLLDDLHRTSPPKQEPSTPALEQRIYSVADSSAIVDLLRSLPEMVPHWDTKRGSIHRLGLTIAVAQPPLVQDRVREIITVLNAEYTKTHRPPKPDPVPAPAVINAPQPGVVQPPPAALGAPMVPGAAPAPPVLPAAPPGPKAP